jgi:uncharacterized protein YodC (DUF2158 family)
MIERRFKIGQTVYLRSGGPNMTVSRLTSDPDGRPSVRTIRFATSGDRRWTGTFMEEWLDEVIGQPIKRIG